MTSPGGKSEKASSSFWKKSPVSAFPGRPNLQAPAATTISKRSSVAPAAAGAGSTTASFRDFEASVSDAWNASADELLPHSHRSIASDANAVTKVHGEAAAATAASHAASAATAKPHLSRTASEENANNGNGSSSKNSSGSSPTKRRIFTGGHYDAVPLSSSKVFLHFFNRTAVEQVKV